jgi:putative two-component system response regulator
LVLTDLYLGEERLGYEIAEFARAMRRPIPVILVTARPSFANAREAMRSHICEIVVKPIDGPTLVAACRRSIDQWEIRRRNQELETQNRTLIDVLPRAIEAKDPTTKGHSERVVHYADGLARRCQVDAEDREALRLASLLHDVGKIGIPNSILRKQGPLTADERQVVQCHPAVGYDILEPLKYSEKVRLWVYQHHERYDGLGYPEGLRGDEVELPGRILILAEVFDALASARSYKPAWKTTKIAEFFRSQAGKHFDPDLSHLVADGLDAEGARFFANGNGLLF